MFHGIFREILSVKQNTVMDLNKCGFLTEEEEEEISPRGASATEDLRHMYFSNSAELRFVRELLRLSIHWRNCV